MIIDPDPHKREALELMTKRVSSFPEPKLVFVSTPGTIHFDGIQPYQREALRLLEEREPITLRFHGKFRPNYVSNRLRRQMGWVLPSNAKLARKRRRIERLRAQRVGRR